ncbi:MAG: hypothetical protein ACPGOY_06995 [Rhodospirillaceae bacterium]
MSYAVLVEKEQRFLILQTLLNDTDRSVNDRMLCGALKSFGHGMGQDAMQRHLHWLKEAKCVEVEELGGLWVATLTSSGAEIVRGDATLPGIAHPADVG